MTNVNKISKKCFYFIFVLLLFTSTFIFIGSSNSKAVADDASDFYFDSITFDKKSCN